MLRSITRNAPAIAVAVTAIVIEGQWFSRKCLADIGPARLLPTLRCGGRELRKLSHDRRLVRHSKIRLPMSALGQKQTSRHLQPMSALSPKADIHYPDASGSIPLFLIASDARAEARNSISRLEPSISS